jgi:hypothetical protein
LANLPLLGGALFEELNISGLDILRSSNPLNAFYRLPRDPPPPLPLRAW